MLGEVTCRIGLHLHVIGLGLGSNHLNMAWGVTLRDADIIATTKPGASLSRIAFFVLYLYFNIFSFSYIFY